MLRPATNINRRGTALAWGGGAVVLVGVLQFLKEELVAFNLDKWPLLVASAAIFLTGLALGEIGSARARRQADQDLEDRLDDALACWPPHRASALSPYDMGVRPALQAEAGPYIPRDQDDEIATALDEADVIVIFGPKGSGKSRSAFNAIPGDAVMLAPEDAEGLATLLQHHESVLIRDDSAVLWLDDFERFVEGLDVDRIMKFARQTPRLSVRRRLGRGERPSTPTIQVVATIRKEALDKLLGRSGDDVGNAAVRRLMSGARGIYLAGHLTRAEKQRFHKQLTRRPEGKTVADAFASTWHGGWQGRELASVDHATPWTRRQIPVMPFLLGVMVLVAVGWLFVKTARDELTVPPPIDQQVSTLIDDATCPVEVFPAKGEGLKDEDEMSNRNILVAIEHGGQCGVSDRVRFYRQRDRRLRELATIAPQSSGSLQRFECRGPTGKDQNACHVVVQGKDQYIIGAFRDAETNLEVPVAISFERGDLTVAPLSLPKTRLPGVPKSIRAEVSRPVDLRLGVADSGQALGATACKEGANCSPTRPAQLTAVVPPEGDRPALLLAGYTTDGTTESPENMLVRIWKLGLDGRRPMLKRNCVMLRDGRIRTVEIPYKADALYSAWKARDSDVMC